MATHTFTRKELYDLVWSEPMIKLAARYGLSGNGLAKACRRANIPVPERGYWAKLQAGKKVRQTPLPEADKNSRSSITIAPPGPQPEKPTPPAQPVSVLEKIQNARKQSKPIVVPSRLSNPHPIIERWLKEDKEEQRRHRHDSWFAHHAIDKTELDKRRLRILSTMLRALEERGYKLTTSGYRSHTIQIGMGADRLEIDLAERIQQVRRKITEEDRKKRSYFSDDQVWTQEKVPTGELILKIKEPDRYGLSKEWRESGDVKLEQQLDDVAAEIAGMFEELRLRHQREAEERQRQRKIEEERRRVQMERTREKIRLRHLLTHCENRRHANEIRSLVSEAESKHSPLSATDDFLKWKTWALEQADRIDPINNDNLFNLDVSDYETYSYKEN